jgi:hypothetical protein
LERKNNSRKGMILFTVAKVMVRPFEMGGLNVHERRKI